MPAHSQLEANANGYYCGVTAVLKHIDILPENTQILDGNAVGLQAECDAFEETIKAAGRD